jgi:hypothetical protein
MIAEEVEPAAAPTVSLPDWLLAKLTRNGRIAFHLACARLTTWESLLVYHVLGRPGIEFYAEAPAGPHLVAVTRSALQEIAFWAPGEQPGPGTELLGWLRIPPHIMEMVNEEASRARARAAMELREIDGILQEWQLAGQLDQKLVELADRVERVETVFIFVGRDVFSKSDAGSNTLTRDGLLEGLRKRPLDDWRESDRLFVVLAHCLFNSGRSVRFEEFNGKQLSVSGVREFLLNRYASYAPMTDADQGSPHALPLFELAERVRALMRAADRSPMMRYRRINGLTFVKNEYLMEFPLPRDPEALPELIAGYGQALGVALTGDVRDDVRRMTLQAVAADAGEAPEAQGSGGQGVLGELLASIVLSAIIRTGADYGMSSSVRDLARLRGAAPGGPDGVLMLKKGDFFCCCLPHPAQMSTDDDEAVAILWRAAQRMMFNRWHFAPGEFNRAVIPDKRHYFFPPQIPDIAEHAEHHHGGHTASRVRYTIRAPGAQVWHSPFTVFGHGFRGCYDIRLVRMEGPPFTLAQVTEAVRHCSLIDEVWRTVAGSVEKGDIPACPIPGFDREWYEARNWERLRPYALASRALGVTPGNAAKDGTETADA